jgi:opacity protein-like surface antigen
MKLRSLALFLAVALASAAANAQTGVYLTFDAQQFTQNGINPVPRPSGNTDRPWIFGPGYGIYYNIHRLPRVGEVHTGPVVLGVDVRGDTLRVSEYGSQLDRQDGILSLRVSPRGKLLNSTPYAMAGFGIGHTRIPYATAYSNNFIYQFGVGLDHNIRGRLDWRVVEADAGALGGYQVGHGANQSNYLVTLSTGFVFRIR